MIQPRSGVRAPAPKAPISDRAEAILGYDPLQELQSLRDAQNATSKLRDEESETSSLLASYEGRYGYPSHFEHERKAKLSTLIEHRRDELRRRMEKVTEAALESYAHSHTEYTRFLERALDDRKEMERLRAKLVELRGQIETARAAEVYFERRCRMAEALIYHSGREAGMA